MAKILIVDDEAQVRFTLAEVLGEAGHQVIAASGGAEALRLADDELDAVISDLAMPGMDGLSVARAVQQENIFCPIVILTMYIDSELRRQAALAGVCAYIHKENAVAEVIPALRALAGGQA